MNSTHLVEGKPYLCCSYSRRDAGLTWFGIAKYVGSTSQNFHFFATCFSPVLPELDWVLDINKIPTHLWQDIHCLDLQEDEPLVYTFNGTDRTVHSGSYHRRMSFPRFQTWSGAYVSGTPICQVNMAITLTMLEAWLAASTNQQEVN